MNSAERKSEDTHARILEVAWDLFRELGARATVADIAARLGMSSANVYRFFPSKQALCEAVAARKLSHLSAKTHEIASSPTTAAERLTAILLTLFEAMRAQMTNEARVHEIVETAIREKWEPIQSYEHDLIALLTGLVVEGQQTGEFGPGDPQLLAIQTMCACSGIHHPMMIALYSGPDAKASPEQIVEFALRALKSGAPVSGSPA